MSQTHLQQNPLARQLMSSRIIFVIENDSRIVGLLYMKRKDGFWDARASFICCCKGKYCFSYNCSMGVFPL